MQKTSSLYQTEVAKQFADQAYIRITFGLTDTDAAATCAPPQTTAGTFWNKPETILHEEGAPKQTYATFEPMRMRADGSQRILPRTDAHSEGFISAALSGADGAFAAADVPKLILLFSKKHTVPGLALTFDPTADDWPAEMLIKAWRDGAVFAAFDYSPNTALFTTPDPIERFDRLDFTFLRMAKPNRRMRLQQIMFGLGLLFENSLVSKAAQKRDVDPITRRLPANTFDFEIVNINAITSTGGQYLYDPDNASGVYKYIGEKAPITVAYGQYLSGGMTWKDVNANSWGELEINGWREVYQGGVTEWVPGGRYYLTGQPSVNGLYASFKAVDILTSLDGTYYKGISANKSLYALAEAVLQDTGLVPIYGDAPPWKLWDGLKQVQTSAPLPVKKHKELLQMIAHAGCCVLYTDREGYIRIEPANETQDNYKLDFHTMADRPKVSQISTLLAVQCPAYTYTAAKVSELYKGKHEVEGTLTVHLTYGQAQGISVAVTGAAVTKQILYAAAADLTLSGHGSAEIIISGQKLEKSAQTLTAFVENPDENGGVETLDNPLITNIKNAQEVAVWVRDYLLLRNTYEFSYRGSPEIDSGDLIWLESQFAPHNTPARVLKSELSFSGGLSGKIMAKRMVKT